MTCGDLKKKGDLGVGTVDGLEGEMVVVDGAILQVKADGKVLPAADGEKIPFATVTSSEPGRRKRCGKWPGTSNCSGCWTA